jgi:hypothetical protein
MLLLCQPIQWRFIAFPCSFHKLPLVPRLAYLSVNMCQIYLSRSLMSSHLLFYCSRRTLPNFSHLFDGIRFYIIPFLLSLTIPQQLIFFSIRTLISQAMKRSSPCIAYIHVYSHFLWIVSKLYALLSHLRSSMSCHSLSRYFSFPCQFSFHRLLHTHHHHHLGLVQ